MRDMWTRRKTVKMLVRKSFARAQYAQTVAYNNHARKSARVVSLLPAYTYTLSPWCTYFYFFIYKLYNTLFDHILYCARCEQSMCSFFFAHSVLQICRKILKENYEKNWSVVFCLRHCVSSSSSSIPHYCNNNNYYLYSKWMESGCWVVCARVSDENIFMYIFSFFCCKRV